MASAEQRLVQWLRDAHAAEEQSETMLSGMARRLENYPDLKARLEQHVRETQRHSELVRSCIERRGETTSAVKDAGATTLGIGQVLSGLFVGDEVMKGVLASSSFEAMEATSYRILIRTAQEVGDLETARVCEEILQEEEAMGAWLNKHVPKFTEQYLSREESHATPAKH